MTRAWDKGYSLPRLAFTISFIILIIIVSIKIDSVGSGRSISRVLIFKNTRLCITYMIYMVGLVLIDFDFTFAWLFLDNSSNSKIIFDA